MPSAPPEVRVQVENRVAAATLPPQQRGDAAQLTLLMAQVIGSEGSANPRQAAAAYAARVSAPAPRRLIAA